MHQPRAWHTATVLPDGTVLIVGGIGRGRRVVADVELFQPATRSFELITDSGVTPRASHTATLLTDGRVLIAGGVSDAGTIDPSAEVWTTAQRTSERLQTSLVAGRRAHAATLLPDGRVWINGGQDGLGRPVLADEVFDPADDDFRSLRHAPVLPGPNAVARLADSSPANKEDYVAPDITVALRFTKPVKPSSVSSAKVRLVGPARAQSAEIVVAEEVLGVPASPAEDRPRGPNPADRVADPRRRRHAHARLLVHVQTAAPATERPGLSAATAATMATTSTTSRRPVGRPAR